MTSKGFKYEEFCMTEEESNDAWDHISTMQSDINEKKGGKMTSKGYKYEEFGMTEEESNEAWDHISTMQSDINEKSTGEQLREVFEDSIFSLGQKMYIAYIFGRTEDRIRELRKIEHESN